MASAGCLAPDCSSVSVIDQAGKIKGQLALGSTSLRGDALKGSNASNCKKKKKKKSEYKTKIKQPNTTKQNKNKNKQTNKKRTSMTYRVVPAHGG